MHQSLAVVALVAVLIPVFVMVGLALVFAALHFLLVAVRSLHRMARHP